MRTPDEVERLWLDAGSAFGVCGTQSPPAAPDDRESHEKV